MTDLHDGPAFSRRGSLGLLSAAAVAAAAGAPAAAAGGKLLDLGQRADYFNAVMQMRGSKDERLCMGFIRGNYYGLVANKLTPLYHVLAGTFSRFKRRADGNYDGATFEVAYFTDWNTNALLDTYLNPLTGKTVKVPITRMGPSRILLTPDGMKPVTTGLPPGMQVNHRFLPARVVGDDVWIVEENFVGTAPDAKGPPFNYNEVTTYRASLKALSDSKQMRAPTDVHFTVVVNWRPWLEMGDIAGNLLGDGGGRHIDRIEDFPPEYVALTRKHHPDAIDDPQGVLAKISFD
jgi:hypothetical protein